MFRRLAATTALTLLAAAAPAAAQDVVAVPQIDIGEAAAVAGTTIRAGGQKIGTLEVERIGEAITVTATFSRRPPGRRASLCVNVEGDRRCIRRDARRGLKITMDRTADFSSPVRATARSGEALGSVAL